MAFCYDFPRPSVTVDCLIFRLLKGELEILLIQRKNEPYKGAWAFPGGFMEIDETPEDAVKREVEEETGLHITKVMQIGAFGAVNRDPRGRTLSIAYLTLLADEQTAKAASDAAKVEWLNMKSPPRLAFDHREILDQGLRMLAGENWLTRLNTSLNLNQEQAEQFTLAASKCYDQGER